MNTLEQPPYPENTGEPAGIGNYIFVAGFVFSFLLLFIVTYSCYMCRQSRSPPTPTVSILSTTHDDTYDHRIRISPGLDDDVLVTFPTFIYSEATVSHKGGTDVNDSGCSICLADYKPAEVVRLLQECGHFFHVKCIDMWLKAHSNCPVCRKSVLAETVLPPLLQS
ncbi:hypothetical protein LXL04_012797 [Taraxacum kok-saghyz]